MSEARMETKVCALTGHRILGRDFPERAMRERLNELAERGVRTFLCGMALGFDLQCGEAIVRLRERYPVRLVACLPCEDQCARFSAANVRRYRALLQACDERIVLHRSYTAGCMFERNRYMVDRCDVLLAYLTQERGGTFYTVNYAKKRGIEIVYIS